MNSKHKTKAARKAKAGVSKKGKAASRRPNTRGDATRDRILDAAEKLFALNTYEGVSMRDIVSEASTELGTLVHHFRSKENIFISVLERRTSNHTAQLVDRLMAKMAEKGESLTPSDILAAYAGSIYENARKKKSGVRYYLQIVAQRVPVEHGRLHPIIAENYIPVREQYMNVLKKYYPDISQFGLDNFFSMYELSFGSVLFSPTQEQFAIDEMGEKQLREMEAIHVKFYAAGFDAIARN